MDRIVVREDDRIHALPAFRHVLTFLSTLTDLSSSLGIHPGSNLLAIHLMTRPFSHMYIAQSVAVEMF
jgi:hypothetical protein